MHVGIFMMDEGSLGAPHRHTSNEGGVGDVVGAYVLGAHAAEDLVGLVGARARAARRHERRVRDHVRRACRVALGCRLHVREHLRRQSLTEHLPLLVACNHMLSCFCSCINQLATEQTQLISRMPMHIFDL